MSAYHPLRAFRTRLKLRMRRLRSLAIIVALSGCATNSSESISVRRAVSAAGEHDGQLVRIKGTVVSWHNGINLHSHDGRECIGILASETSIARFRAFEGRGVTLSGRLEAEGCGRKGICDEHVCGPSVLSEAQLVD
jgi:hypothetical protein